ncbi:uncharacterized protein LOC125518405 [Triticum urartu]|uniref:uncharacterized protein LOC125518405 n=1 Tax=Triticum urartu TaxID=4572 RepID=UPI0020444D08|nr:uncharacterized protein LOC125518405 [Triticum urartu]
MDQFHDRQHVRLRSRVLGTYLHADHDGERVSLSRRRDSLNTAWVAHIHQRADGPYLLLHSAAYGRYLGTTFKPAPLGHHGCRTEQRDYDDEPDLMAVMWKAAGAGFDDVVLLRNAAGRYLSWNTGVTVDNIGNISAMMYWTVEHIPAREGPPGPIHTPSPGYHSLMLWRNPVVSRLIRFMLSDPHGPIYTQHCWTTLRFRGRSVFHLRDELARRIAFVLDGRQSCDLVMCVRAGRRGRLTPLVVDLPSSGYGETLWIVVFMSGTPGSVLLVLFVSVNLDELARRIAFVLDGRQSCDLVILCTHGKTWSEASRNCWFHIAVLDSDNSVCPFRFDLLILFVSVNLGELARRIAFVLDRRQSFDLVMCVRAGCQGRLTPLIVDLPSSGYGETLWIVVFMSGTPDFVVDAICCMAMIL